MSLTNNEIAALFTRLMTAPPDAHLAVVRLHNEVVDYAEEGLTNLPRGWLIEALLGGSNYGEDMLQTYYDTWLYHHGDEDADEDDDANEVDDYLTTWVMAFDEAMGYYSDLDGEAQMSVLNILGWGDGSEPAGDPSQVIEMLEDNDDPQAMMVD
jgi:hypothetical protein